jgi:hypothetical protein
VVAPDAALEVESKTRIVRSRRLLAVVAVGAAALLAVGGAGASQARVVHVHVYMPRGAVGPTCSRVLPLPRTVRAPAVLSGAMRALVRGPTRAERSRGYGGWFSAKTAGTFRSARVENGVAYVDFVNFSRRIPNASSSCGSALLLAQLDRTAKQLPGVRRTVYSFDGSARAFYEWLQRSPPVA